MFSVLQELSYLTSMSTLYFRYCSTSTLFIVLNSIWQSFSYFLLATYQFIRFIFIFSSLNYHYSLTGCWLCLFGDSFLLVSSLFGVYSFLLVSWLSSYLSFGRTCFYLDSGISTGYCFSSLTFYNFSLFRNFFY